MRAQIDPFAYAKSGELLVGVDHSEVIAYDGASEAPLWLVRASDEVVAVGITGDQVITVDVTGFLQRWSAQKGTLLESKELIPESPQKHEPSAVAIGDGGQCAVALHDRLFVMGSVGRRELHVRGVVDLAFRDDGMALALGMSSGEVRLVDLHGHVLTATRLDAPVDSLCWSPEGVWFISSQGRIYSWDGSSHKLCFALDTLEPVVSLSCSQQGGLLAFRVGIDLAVAFDIVGGRPVADVEYFDRPVGVVAFGPDLWLGIGLDHADANKIDLATSAVHRTDTYAGREHRSWSLGPAILSAAAISAEGGEPASAPQEAEETPTIPSRRAYKPAPGAETRALQLRTGGRIRCPGCSSPTETVVCEFCGAVTEEIDGSEGELRVIADFHRVMTRVDGEVVRTMLRGGYMPATPGAVVEAGLRCIPFLTDAPLESEEPRASAIVRVEAVLDRLRAVASPDPVLRSDIAELERHVADAKRSRKRGLHLGLILLLTLVLLAFGGIAWLVWG